MKFLVPSYSCLQNPWLGGYCPQVSVLSVLCPQLNFLNPPEQNSWIRHCCLVFLKTEYQCNNAFATLCDNHATSCSFYPRILVPAVNRVLWAVICGIPLFHGDLVCRQSPFHYCASALHACSVLKCEICVLHRRPQISCNWVLCDTVKVTSHHTKPNWTEPRRNWGTNCHLNRFLWIVLREREPDSDWWCVENKRRQKDSASTKASETWVKRNVLFPVDTPQNRPGI